jgi:hypothetical protein
VGRVAQSVYRLATGWTVRGSRFFAHVHTDPEAHPASCTMGTGSFPGVKRPGRGADHPSPSSAEVKKEYSYTSTHPLGHFRPVMGLLYLYCDMNCVTGYFIPDSLLLCDIVLLCVTVFLLCIVLFIVLVLYCVCL